MKPRLSSDRIASFLDERLSGTVKELRPLTEGEERQALAFRHDRESLVIRIAPNLDGFLKEAFVSMTFGNGPIPIPIPRIFAHGQIDDDHAFAISPLMAGTTIQEVDEPTLLALVTELDQVLNGIHALDPGETTGFGPFDQHGTGAFSSWRAFLAQPLEEQRDPCEARIDRTWYRNTLHHLERLIPACPEIRRLVHGDFGSNNVLTDGQGITGVLDWESALVGDPLYDWANILYWAPWLACMRIQSDHLTTSPAYRGDPWARTRLYCYQLHIGLRALDSAARDGDARMLRWHTHRIGDVGAGESGFAPCP